jgi:DNA-binding Lrp family transcriptional regulator
MLAMSETRLMFWTSGLTMTAWAVVIAGAAVFWAILVHWVVRTRSWRLAPLLLVPPILALVGWLARRRAPAAGQKRCQEPYDFKVPDTFSDAAGPATRPLSGDQKELVRLLQDGLPIQREPFVGAGAQLGWPVERIVEQIREWMGMGIVRRFGAVVRHRDLGFAANGMAVFRAAEAQADEAGRRLAARPEVSHCYRRPPLEDFPFNLYAMVHGRSENQVRQAVAAMAAEAGLTDYDVLFSVTEFKKASMRYFVE